MATRIDPLTGEILDHKGRPLTASGAEIPDPIPLQPPVGYKKQPPLHELIRQMVRSEKLAQEAEAAGYETFEEAEDFEVGDDFEPYSPHETEELDGFVRDQIRAGNIRPDENGEPAFFPEKPMSAEPTPAPQKAQKPDAKAPKGEPEKPD